MSSVYCSSALLLRLLSPVSLLLSLCWSPHIMLAMLAMLLMLLMPCSTAGAELTGSLVVWRLGGSGGLREEEEEVLESWPGSGDTSECRSEEIPEEVEPVELDLGTGVLLELRTKVHEDFTILEVAPTRAFYYHFHI